MGDHLIAALFLLATTVTGPSPSIQLPTCLIIKPYVLLYGPQAAIEFARRHGYTEAQIREIRKVCKI